MARPLSGRQVQTALRELSTCNLSDALDRLGMAGEVTGILPLWPGWPRIADLAMTMQLGPDATYSTVAPVII